MERLLREIQNDICKVLIILLFPVVVFSLADTALALACNGRNKASVTLESAINFIKPVHKNDIITAETTEIHNGQSTGLYQITITNQTAEKVAVFKGTCFRTGKAIV